ncbi:MAG: hypothetical protein JW841_01620 [Deltaproteobacteria bacterium]|nr:hypothetical protein [Deltaproteobacteria bacterium]
MRWLLVTFSVFFSSQTVFAAKSDRLTVSVKVMPTCAIANSASAINDTLEGNITVRCTRGTIHPLTSARTDINKVTSSHIKLNSNTSPDQNAIHVSRVMLASTSTDTDYLLASNTPASTVITTLNF